VHSRISEGDSLPKLAADVDIEAEGNFGGVGIEKQQLKSNGRVLINSIIYNIHIDKSGCSERAA